MVPAMRLGKAGNVQVETTKRSLAWTTVHTPRPMQSMGMASRRQLTPADEGD